MRNGRDHYETLGVSRDAGNDEIRKAFRRKAKEYHPDSNTGGSAAAFREAQQAYEVLRDRRARSDYDRELRERESGGIPRGGFRPASDSDVDRAFANLWDLFFAAAADDGRPREARYREKKSREPIDYTVHLTAKEAVEGTTVHLPHEGRRPMVVNIPPGVYHGQVLTNELRDLFGRREIRLHIDIRG
ncbi:MAG: DnaJ domain-containing protein [Spirochaetales bacterium]